MSTIKTEAVQRAERAERAAAEGRTANPSDQIELAKSRRADRLRTDRGHERVGRWTAHYRQIDQDGTFTASVWLTGTDFVGERMFGGATVEEVKAKVAEFAAR